MGGSPEGLGSPPISTTLQLESSFPCYSLVEKAEMHHWREAAPPSCSTEYPKTFSWKPAPSTRPEWENHCMCLGFLSKCTMQHATALKFRKGLFMNERG